MVNLHAGFQASMRAGAMASLASEGPAADTDEPDEATLRLQREFQERVDINCGERCCKRPTSHRRRSSPPMRTAAWSSIDGGQRRRDDAGHAARATRPRTSARSQRRLRLSPSLTPPRHAPHHPGDLLNHFEGLLRTAQVGMSSPPHLAAAPPLGSAARQDSPRPSVQHAQRRPESRRACAGTGCTWKCTRRSW